MNYTSMVPDEIWFYGEINRFNQFINDGSILEIPNYLGYGQIYWIIYSLFNDIVAIRMIALICVLATVFFTYKSIKLFSKDIYGQIIPSIIVLFMFTFPILWFTGKIIGPEILGTSFGAIACYCYFYYLKKQKNFCYILSMIFLAISCSVKVSNVIFGVFIAVYILCDFWGSWIKLLKSISIGIVTFMFSFVILNPMIFLNFHEWKNNIFIVSGSWDVHNFKRVLIEDNITWDL